LLMLSRRIMVMFGLVQWRARLWHGLRPETCPA
jgi:hypothetical protein